MPYSPQSNGVVEWEHRTIIERERCILDFAGRSKRYWAMAVLAAVYLKNPTPICSVVGKTPYEAWHGSGHRPSLRHLHVFGCLAFVHVPQGNHKKLDCRASPSVFVGYRISTKLYFVYDPVAKMIHRSRDVVLSERKRYTAPNAADEAILVEHFYRAVIEEPNHTEKQPTRDESSECQTEEPLDDDSPPDSLNPKTM
jgi:hypothetical protein